MTQPTPFPHTKGIRIDLSTCSLRSGVRIGLSHIQCETFINEAYYNYLPVQSTCILQHFLLRIITLFVKYPIFCHNNEERAVRNEIVN